MLIEYRCSKCRRLLNTDVRADHQCCGQTMEVEAAYGFGSDSVVGGDGKPVLQERQRDLPAPE